MKQDEAEQAIRNLCHDWASEKGFDRSRYGALDFFPSFSEFESWLHDNRYGHYLDFRPKVGSARYVAQMWFDEEFKKTGIR